MGNSVRELKWEEEKKSIPQMSTYWAPSNLPSLLEFPQACSVHSHLRAFVPAVFCHLGSSQTSFLPQESLSHCSHTQSTQPIFVYLHCFTFFYSTSSYPKINYLLLFVSWTPPQRTSASLSIEVARDSRGEGYSWAPMEELANGTQNRETDSQIAQESAPYSCTVCYPWTSHALPCWIFPFKMDMCKMEIIAVPVPYYCGNLMSYCIQSD